MSTTPEQDNMSRLHKYSIDFLAGATSGGITRMALAPLDLIKIRLQTQGKLSLNNKVYGPHYAYNSFISSLVDIYKNEGFIGFWRGNLLAEMLYISYLGIQFSFYQPSKKLYTLMFSYENPVLESVFGGAVAAVLATSCTYPLDLLRTRFAAQSTPRTYNSIPQAIRIIYRREGIGGFYSGWLLTASALIPAMAIQFSVYEYLKENALKSYKDNTYVYAASGAIAGITSKLAVMPLDVLKKRLQMHGFYSCQHEYYSRVTIINMARSMYLYGGVKCFYKGITPSVIKAMLGTSLGFTLYENTKKYITNYFINQT